MNTIRWTTISTWTTGLMAVAAMMWISGCGRTQSTSADSVPASSATIGDKEPADTAASTSDEEHGHKPGAHGGIMVSLGQDSYHAEAVFEKGGVLRLYTLGQDETRVIDVDVQTLKGYVRSAGASESLPFSLTADRQDGDADGRTSQFVGTLPDGLAGGELEVTIPNIVIAGERFRLGFQSTAAAHDSGMPAKVADAAERSLYLEPGGLYTAADIEANGNVTASEKFRGLQSSHDMSPKTGDKICPVTKTKANPVFTWIVGGKPYEFCCPPCVDEFVKLAKTDPTKVLEPDAYKKE